MSKAIAVENHEDQNPSPALQSAAAGPARLVQFLKDVRLEMHKVVTPTRDAVQASTIVVIVTVFIFAAYFELVDLVLGTGIDKIFTHLTKH